MSKSIKENIDALNFNELIQLAGELQRASHSEDALVRKVITDTNLDATQFHIALLGVGMYLSKVLSERLAEMEEVLTKTLPYVEYAYEPAFPDDQANYELSVDIRRLTRKKPPVD